ncbi:adhesion G protein-coupled receptor E3-like [Clarias gariepinus]|uniref:adhesion G protein-coupled receptor E3-like n=1 Tax=Clarias gariepinus TaxID=13013 RepID=UPI00234C75F1|nr:adhesion G protein-coupled receptor E3-like [Clarias gariepinus]
MTLTTRVIASVLDQNYLIQYANLVLKVSETLVATLVTTSNNSSNISLSLPNLDVEILMAGSNPLITEIPQFGTGNAFMDIDLVHISKNNNTAVAFLSYTNLGNLLKPTFQTSTNTNNTMMSTVVSVSLLKTTNTNLTNAVNITFKHISKLDPEGILSCVNWDEDTATLQENICNIIQTNNTHTVCSCDQLSTFALIMRTDQCRVR